MSGWPTTRRRGWLLALILLLGTALRLWLWWRTPIHQPANDEVEYLTVARDLLAGRGWQFYERYHWLRAPLYPLWLAGSLRLAQLLPGVDLRWAALPNIALSSATVYLFYLLGAEVGRSGRRADEDAAPTERIGLLTATCAALLLTLATFASLWMAETLFTALFIGALLALLRWAARPRLALAAAAGLLLGLAILTRSLPLTALPFVALWMVVGGRWSVVGDQEERIDRSKSQNLKSKIQNSVIQNPKSKIQNVAAFVLVAALVIAPWTIRNYRAYGALIAVETGLSYNLWAFNEPREDQATIFRTLENIRNPAARADYATAKGLERLREDPLILARKLWPNWVALWRVKPIQDRFLQPTYYQDIPVGMFATALVLDDALYMLIAVLGLGGLLVAPLDRRKMLLGGWLLYQIGVVLLTHGEGRYRHFIFPVLLPYAAWLLVRLRQPGWLRRHLPLLALAALLLALLLPTPLALRYPGEWAVRNLRRGWAVQRAEWAARAGDASAALALQQRATEIDPGSADTWLGLGLLHQRFDQPDAALAAFETAFAREPSYVATNIRRGDALRRAGRLAEAAQVFRGYYTDEVEMLEWAWAQLGTPPPAAVAVGDGLDFGYVHGMYAAEEQLGRRARWTGARAELKLAGSAEGGVVRLTLAAPWPAGQAVPTTVCIDAACYRLTLGPQWRSYALLAPPAAQSTIRIIAPTFRPSERDPQSPDRRALGVLVDHAALTPLAR